MAYEVKDSVSTLAPTVTSPPWEGRYTSWYVSGKYAWLEPTRPEDSGGHVPCRALMLGDATPSGDYRVYGEAYVSPYPRATGG